MSNIIFLFLDGFGLGTAQQHNPIFTSNLFSRLLGQPLINGISISSERMIAKSIDAQLGIEGTPQSATGQTALFTGINAAEYLGYHLPAFPNNALISLIQQHSLFKVAIQSGKQATFANAYSNDYFEAVAAGKRYHSVTTHACLAAHIPFRTIETYNNSEAIFWDITGEYTQERIQDPIPLRSPEQAGKTIAALSQKYDLVVFESFLPDVIGHSRDLQQARHCCDTINRFIQSLCKYISDMTTVVITSDHGNFEDLSYHAHTTNPVPLLVYGFAAQHFSDVQSIVGVPQKIVSIL